MNPKKIPTFDVDAIRADICKTMDICESQNDRWPRGELIEILREHEALGRWRWAAFACDLWHRWIACEAAWREKLMAGVKIPGMTYARFVEEIAVIDECNYLDLKKRAGLYIRPCRDWRSDVPRIQKLLDKGYTTKEIADALSTTPDMLLQAMKRIRFPWPDQRSKVARARLAKLRERHGLPPVA